MIEELVARPLAGAFLDVGIYVALFAAAAAWLRWRHGDRLHEALRRRPRTGPVVGALLGVSPGCGGAVLVMPLYVRGHVSFGTVVAALTATMGDSSWVVMAGAPRTALALHAVLLVTGLVTGFAVDALGIDPRRRFADRDGATTVAAAASTGSPDAGLDHRGPSPSPAVPADLPVRRPVLHVLGPTAVAFWLLTGAGAGIGIPVSFRLLDPAVLTDATGTDLHLLLGAAGGLLCVALFLHGRGRFADDDPHAPSGGCWAPNLADGMRHAAHETAFVVVWVAVAYAALAFVDTTVGVPLESLPLFGLAGVVVGALVGLVPGCGLQIAFTGAFLAGGAGAPALLANAVAQDGDALLPLIALDRRAAAVASVITTVPAVTVGGLALLVL